MARVARVEAFAPDEIATIHVMNRVVRRCFLMGTDELTGKNYDHRKIWVENELKRLSAGFGIDLLSMAILSNHFHLILRSRPDVVQTWDDTEVARRWLLLRPVRKSADGSAAEPSGKQKRGQASFLVSTCFSTWVEPISLPSPRNHSSSVRSSRDG